MAGRTPKWFFAEPKQGRYVVVNPTEDGAPVSLETPAGTIVECEEFGVRPHRDRREERGDHGRSDGEIGALRIKVERRPRLTINGIDVSDALVGPDEAGVRLFLGLNPASHEERPRGAPSASTGE